MLAEEKLDVLLNGVSSDSNPMAVGLAAKHGVHPITEIPIAPTLRIADYMVQTCERHRVKLEVTEQVFLWAPEQLKRKIIESGLIGEVTHARLLDQQGRLSRPQRGAHAPAGRGHPRAWLLRQVRVPHFVGYEGELVQEDSWDAAIIEFDSGVVCLFEDPPRGRMSSRWDIEGTLGQLVGMTSTSAPSSAPRTILPVRIHHHRRREGPGSPARGDRPAHRLREPLQKLWRRR